MGNNVLKKFWSCDPHIRIFVDFSHIKFGFGLKRSDNYAVFTRFFITIEIGLWKMCLNFNTLNVIFLFIFHFKRDTKFKTIIAFLLQNKVTFSAVDGLVIFDKFNVWSIFFNMVNIKIMTIVLQPTIRKGISILKTFSLVVCF
ncbi:hypothetical protein Barb6_03538 [Bacteroidales bacterium Barb6]|nr:hypothetical protein Barb6_03538 [Bacteroidales bacterium Barb6]